ncbi:hypothetical protein UK82_28065 [Frankia sp. ACN1ag]|nr:hypothetical protein UK82_28065 [Frankia sp. ACN1ag]
MAGIDERAQAQVLVDRLLEQPDDAADRVVAVLHAHAAALAWVRDSVGLYPASPEIAAVLNDLAGQLRDVGDERDPVAVLGQAAVDAPAAYRAAAAA